MQFGEYDSGDLYLKVTRELLETDTLCGVGAVLWLAYRIRTEWPAAHLFEESFVSCERTPGPSHPLGRQPGGKYGPHHRVRGRAAFPIRQLTGTGDRHWHVRRDDHRKGVRDTISVESQQVADSRRGPQLEKRARIPTVVTQRDNVCQRAEDLVRDVHCAKDVEPRRMTRLGQRQKRTTHVRCMTAAF